MARPGESPVPEPPDFTQSEPGFTRWPVGKRIHRVYKSSYDANAFNPGNGDGGRFHFFPAATGAVVPVLYGSNQVDGAIAEVVFRDVPLTGPVRTVRERLLDDRALGELHPERDLRLVELLGFGLRRLGLMPEQLTATESSDYTRTVPWARKLHETFPDVDGLVWMSRQFNAAEALMLFGDRVDPRDLTILSEGLPLALGPGRTLVERAANRAGIAIIGG